MSDINKRIHENAAALAKVKAGLCECGGVALICLDCWHPDLEDGYTREETCGDCQSPHPTPCPTCATLREVAGQCWHEAGHPHFIAGHFNQPHPYSSATKEASCKNGCGLKWDNGMKIGGTGSRSLEATFRNPTYTVPIMRTLLEDIWELNPFLAWLWSKCKREADVNDTAMVLDFARILMSDSVMRIMIADYLEHRVEEVA